MKTGIKEQTTKYYVNKERGTVVCVIEGYIRVDLSTVKFSAKGIAKCRECDEFNETVGRRIAESRAKQKMFKFAQNVAKECYNSFLPIIENIQRLIESNKHCYLAEVNHTNDLLKDV